MIRVVVVELVLLGLIWLFAWNLTRARKGEILYSGTRVASRRKHPKTFWSVVLFSALMLAFIGYCAIDFGLKGFGQ